MEKTHEPLLKALLKNSIIIEEDEPLKIQFGNVKCILTEHNVNIVHILQMKTVETKLSSTRIQQKLLSKVWHNNPGGGGTHL